MALIITTMHKLFGRTVRLAWRLRLAREPGSLSGCKEPRQAKHCFCLARCRSPRPLPLVLEWIFRGTPDKLCLCLQSGGPQPWWHNGLIREWLLLVAEAAF